MKQLEARIAIVNILVSWVWSSSRAPIPSVSMTIILTCSPSDDVPLMGVPQHQRPLVHGLTVGPTPKPLLRFRRTRLSR